MSDQLVSVADLALRLDVPAAVLWRHRHVLPWLPMPIRLAFGKFGWRVAQLGVALGQQPATARALLRRASLRDPVTVSGFLAAVAKPPAGKRSAGPCIEARLYSGVPLATWSDRAVVDLDGVQLEQRVPLLRDGTAVGFSVSVRQANGRGIVAVCELLKTGGGAEVLGEIRGGFPWRGAARIEPLQLREVPAGRAVRVNGRDLQGPLVVVERSRLGAALLVPVSGIESEG